MALIHAVNGIFFQPCALGEGWCPHPELNWDQRFRKQRSLPSCRYQENTINIGRSSFCNDSVTPNLIPPSDTVSMKAENNESASLWTKAPVANLVRYEPSGIYFARAKVRGKLVRKSLDTNILSVAKLRLADVLDAEPRAVANQDYREDDFCRCAWNFQRTPKTRH